MTNPKEEVSSQTFAALPVELLETIFEHFVTIGAPRPLAGSSPTRLCLVCRQWRDVAINCPKLWCAIRLTSTQLQRLAYMNVWLERSKQLPLAVGLWTKGYYKYDRAVAEVLRTFWQSGRSDGKATYMVEEMEINLHQNYPLHIQSNHTVSYPFLRKLSITQSGYSSSQTFLSPQTFLEIMPSRAPNLQKLVWWGPSFGNVLAALVQSSSIATALTSIDLATSLSTTDCFTIFSTFPLLRRSILKNINAPGQGQLFHKHLTMHHLQELVVTGDVNPLNIIHRLTAPHLISLTLAATDPKASFSTNAVIPASMLSDFLLRSAASLRDLTIEDIPLAHDEFPTILKNLNELEMLSVYDGLSPTSQWGQHKQAHIVLQTLSPPKESSSSGSYACPNLRTLILRGGINSPDGFLSQLVEDRFDRSQRGEGVELESIQMESYHNHHTKDDERLQVLSLRMMNCGKNLKVKVSGVMLGQVVHNAPP